MDTSDPAATSARPAAWRLRVAGLLLLAFAAGLRAALLGAKPFWADEAWLAWLVERPFGEMLATIPHTTAPLGFALATRLAAQLPGLAPETAMRLLPLAAGIATVALLPLLVRSWGGSRRAAAIAMVLAAAMPALVNYSRELKPYALDAFVATAFPIAILRLLDSAAAGTLPASPLRVRLLPTAIALTSPFLCFGGAFPIAAGLGWGWAKVLRRRLAGTRGPLLAATAPFLAVAALLAVVLLRRQAANPILLLDFGVAPPPLSGMPAEVLRRLAVLLTTAFGHQFPGGAPAAMLLAAFGLLAWPPGRRAGAAAMAGGTLLLAATAAAAGFYVVSLGRLVLFTAPFTVAAVAVGLDRAAEILQRVAPLRRVTGIVLVLAVGGLGLFWSWRAVEHRLGFAESIAGTRFLYDRKFETEGLLDTLVRRRGPGEPVLVGQGLRHAVRYYANEPIREPVTFAERSRHARQPPALRLAPWLAELPARGWIVIRQGRMAVRYRAAIERAGFSVSETRFDSALLWEVTRPPSP